MRFSCSTFALAAIYAPSARSAFHMLSVVNTTAGKKVANIKIEGDTLEAMALKPSSPLLYINNPSKSLVDVVNRRTHAVASTWPVTMGRRNIASAAGGKNELLVPEMQRLFVTIPPRGSASGKVYVY